MIEFITAELAAAGWLEDRVGLEMFSYRPNRGHSERFEPALHAAAADGARGRRPGKAYLAAVRQVLERTSKGPAPAAS